MAGEPGPPALRLVLPADMLRQIIEHSRSGYPEEVCGIVAGRAGIALTLHPGRNIAVNPRVEYELDEQTLLKLTEFDATGLELAAIYHSHPQGPAHPSETDVARAFYPDAVYLICSLESWDHPVVHGFRIASGSITPVGIVSS